MTRKIFVGNYKGGVGKTTFTYNMGCILRKKGNRVLLIDLDPQSSLSEICFNTNKIGKFSDLKGEETLNYIIDIYSKAIKANVYEKLKFNINELIKDNGYVKFIPSSYFYNEGGLDIQCLMMNINANYILIMKRFIEDSKIDKMFDYIIFDCPPSNNIITLASFFVCDYYVIPTIMDYVSTTGIEHYEEVLRRFYKKYLRKRSKLIDVAFGKRPKMLGIFESKKKTQVNTNRFRRAIKNDKEYFLFNSVIYDYKEISDSLERGEPSKKGQFIELVQEIEQRIKELDINAGKK